MTSTDRALTDPTVRVSAAPARTDVTRPGASGADPATTPAPVPLPTVRAVGVALAVFSAVWAGGMQFGLAASAVAGTLSAVAFQGSLLALLAVMWRTAATGTRRAGRILLGVQAGVLAVATVQSISEAVPGAVADTLTTVLDPFWPLSMLGMLVVGVTVACVGRWRGVARVWAAVATSWIALLPVMMIAPEGVGGLVALGHILVGYVVLGVVLAVRPQLVRA